MESAGSTSGSSDESAPDGVDIVLEYEDLKEGVSFTLHPPRDRTLDAAYHPNAYAWLEWGERDGLAPSVA